MRVFPARQPFHEGQQLVAGDLVDAAVLGDGMRVLVDTQV